MLKTFGGESSRRVDESTNRHNRVDESTTKKERATESTVQCNRAKFNQLEENKYYFRMEPEIGISLVEQEVKRINIAVSNELV